MENVNPQNGECIIFYLLERRSTNSVPALFGYIVQDVLTEINSKKFNNVMSHFQVTFLLALLSWLLRFVMLLSMSCGLL